MTCYAWCLGPFWTLNGSAPGCHCSDASLPAAMSTVAGGVHATRSAKRCRACGVIRYGLHRHWLQGRLWLRRRTTSSSWVR